MQTLIDQLVETRKLLQTNSKHIDRLQQEIRRLQQHGVDAREVRGKLAQFHTLHMQVLAVHEQLQKMLNEIGG